MKTTLRSNHAMQRTATGCATTKTRPGDTAPPLPLDCGIEAPTSKRSAVPVIVRGTGELETLLRRNTFTRARTRFVLDMPDLAPGASTEALERRLNRLANACGCPEGALCGLVGALGSVLWACSVDTSWDVERLARVAGAAVAFGLAGVVLGKLLGMGLARFRLRRLIASLSRTSEAIHPGADRP